VDESLSPRFRLSYIFYPPLFPTPTTLSVAGVDAVDTSYWPGTSIPIHGGLSLRPVKNRGEYISCTDLFFYSNVSLFPLYPVQYKFIANFSCGGIASILIVHFDICTAFCPKCVLMAAGGSGGGSFRKGG